MSVLNWKDFLAAGYPPEKMAAEAGRDIPFRIHRWVGLRLAFPFYRLGVTANALSVIRALMAISGVCMLATAVEGEFWLPFFGAVLVYLQVLLDFSDGAIAAAVVKKSTLGLQYDIMGNDCARVCIFALLGIYTGMIVMILVAVAAEYVMTTFRWSVEEALPSSPASKAFRSLSRLLMSERFFVVVLPIALVLIGAVGGDLARVSFALVSMYAAMALTWLVVSARGQ